MRSDARCEILKFVGATVVACVGLVTSVMAGEKMNREDERKAFDKAAQSNWKGVFADDCTGDWERQWFLDGEIGTVKTGPDGMTLTAGPEFKNDAHHMVLWTKDSFEGDLKIEYDYTRLDRENRCVTILYVQATGSGREPYAEDISEWNELRKIPSMKTYYNNINAYHISYAANPSAREKGVSYIRGRRYMPNKAGLKGTDLKPDYYPKGLFEPGVKHHITVIKTERDLYMRVENPQQVYYCHMINTKLPPITEGRIGLRHMFTRSARYQNFRVSTPARKAVADSGALGKYRKQRLAFRDKFMEEVLAHPKEPTDKGKIDAHAPVYAMAALYTNKDLTGGNERLRGAWERAAGADKKLTPEEASKVKWHMRGMLRVYYLFYKKSDFFPGRLEKDVQTKLEEIFFNYGCYKSTVKRAQLDKIWHIQGSENHDMMDLSNAYLALQAVQNLDLYKDRKLPDGHTPAEHVKAWEKYYALYALERAKNGLFVEISPTYGKWFLGELVNMYDFAEDPTVKRRMEMLLHLTWADWSVDQINGVRGGGKSRCYQGTYSQSGNVDSWDRMARHLMGIEPWIWNSHGGLSTLALSTSGYELPDVVLDIALNKGDIAPFVYQSMRPARQLKSPRGFYVMDPKGGGILRYSYCTQEAILGSWMLDTRASYAAINSQNRWQGIIFATGPNARVFPQSEGLGNGKTYNQHVAVQHRNVMVVAHHPKARQTGQMRVFFPSELRKRLVEIDGWAIVKEGKAWLGVRPLGDQGFDLKALQQKEVKEASRQNTDGFWLWPKADKPHVVFVVSRVAAHKTVDEFAAYLASHKHAVAGGVATYTFVDDLGAEARLEVGGKLPVPKVNGSPVNLYPKEVFDCRYLSSLHGSGVVTIEKGDRKLTLDFRE